MIPKERPDSLCPNSKRKKPPRRSAFCLASRRIHLRFTPWAVPDLGNPSSRSRRTHRAQEFRYFNLEPAGVARQRLRRGEHLRRRRSCFSRATLHIRDIGRHLLGALRGVLDVAGDFLRRSALLFNGGCDRRGNLGKSLDRVGDILDRADRIPGSPSECRRFAGRSPRSPSPSARRAP